MLERVIETRLHDLGGGFQVGRLLPYRERRMVGPFIFFDRMGPHDLVPPVPHTIDVRPHPHIGLSTVTYLFDGELTHRDSTGVEQVIRPGALNWMTAGSGISHSERFDGMRVQGGHMDGIQAWVAVPAENEEDRCSFAHHPAESLPRWQEAGVTGCLIAGSAYGSTSPAVTHSPLFYLHVEMAPGARVAMPEGYDEGAAFVSRGSVEHEGTLYLAGQMLVFQPGSAATMKAVEPTRLMLLGGDTLGARHIWWNFVSSRKDRIEQAKADWVAGRFLLPSGDDREYVPLPGGPKPPPQPM